MLNTFSQLPRRQRLIILLSLLVILVMLIGLAWGIFIGRIKYGAAGTVLSLRPANPGVRIGQEQTFEVRLNTGGQDVVAVRAAIEYDSTLLEVVSVDTATSVFPYEIREGQQPSILRILRGIPGNKQIADGVGFNGTGAVAKVTFRAKAAGTAKLSFGKASMAILDDGNGTQSPIALKGASARITIGPSETHYATNKPVSSSSSPFALLSRALAGHSADLTGDNKVDEEDLTLLQTQWQQSGTADLDHDGTVNVPDAGILFSNWGALPEPPPPPPPPSGPNPALFYDKAETNTSESQLRFMADHAALVFHAKEEQAEFLKSINPKLLVIFYDLPGGIIPANEDWEYVDARESWFVQDENGSRLREEPEESGFRLLDLGNSDYKTYEMDLVANKVAAAYYDGVFFDVSVPDWVPGRTWYDDNFGVSAPPDSYKHAWPDLALTFHQEIHGRLSGKLHIFNSLPLNPGRYEEYRSHFEQIIATTDGLQLDGFCYNREQPWRKESWTWQLDQVKQLNSQGKITLLKVWSKHPNGTDLDNQIRKFCFASYLMVADSVRTMYEDVDGWLETLFTAPLGAASGPYYTILSGNIFRRDFANGTAVANPSTTGSFTVDLGGTYYTLDGKEVTSITLRANSAEVLLKSAP